MKQNQKFNFKGQIKVVDIVDNLDGTAKVIFEANAEFKKCFKEYYGLKRWSQKAFNKFLEEAIENTNRLYKEGLLEAKNKEDEK